MHEMILTARKKKGTGVVSNYPDFQTFVNKNVTGTVAASTSPQLNAGYRQTTLNIVDQGTMWGTPWLNYFTYDSPLIRVARHAFPDKVTADENVTSKRVIVAKYVPQGTRSAYQGLARNGYTSSAYGSFTGQQIVDFIYWDASLNKAMRLNPFLGEAPKEFDGVLK